MPAARPLALLFDLDGTLIDSIELLLSSMRHAFATRGIPAPSDARWIEGIGTPLATQLRELVRDEAEVAELVDAYRTHQRLHHDRLVSAYPGVVNTLRTLRARGHQMAIVTSKADELAARGVEHAGLAPFLDTIVGCDSCTMHKPEPEPVFVALARLDRAPRDAIFIGDSPHDIASGNAAGVVTVAALWGPFSRAQLQAARPIHWLEDITALPALVGRLGQPASIAEHQAPGDTG